MKRYLSIFLIACLLTGCVNGKPSPALNEIASRDTGGAPKTGEANEGGYNEKAIRRYAEDNLSIYTTDEGEKCLWIDDYDDNGKLAAYAIVKKDDGLKLIYIDENLQPREVRGVEEDRFDDNPHLFVAGKDAYLYLRKLFTTGGMGYLYGVKDNEVYEPDISSHIDLFDKVGDHFVNNETYLERTKAGGVRKEREMTYAYDQKSRQFVIAEKKEGQKVERGKVAVTIEGKKAGSIDVLIEDGTTYHPVGEMNRLLVENYKLEDVSEEDRQLFFEDTTTYCMKDETSNAWFFLAWPGAGYELYEGYYVDKNIIIDQFDDYDAPRTYEYMQPKHRPIEKGSELYMDAETLKANFPMDYEESRGAIKIKEVYGNRSDAWKTIKASPDIEIDDLVENKL